MNLEKLNKYTWIVPQTGAMNVPAMIFVDEAGRNALVRDNALEQAVNVACLPGIVKASMAMPDIHQGYGFPIGGVAAFDWATGIVSPGGVGYDINCGVRLARTRLEEKEIRPFLFDLANRLFREIPCGVGCPGIVKLSDTDQDRVLRKGSRWAVEQGFGRSPDIERTEEKGCLAPADPGTLSPRALERGKNQLGSLGSGNHFLEIGKVDQIFDQKIARVFGLFQGQVTVMLHTGSRGLGYQVCDDSLKLMAKEVNRLGIRPPDRQLAYAPLSSGAGELYMSAMACAANYAWANRQVLMHRAEQVIQKTLSISPATLGMGLVYDVCHNIAKKETHRVEGSKKSLCLHRKGATRSFGPGHPSIPAEYRSVGQPIIIPGDMGRASYVLAGTQKAMDLTFGSTCHGAGRVLSRRAAKKAAKGRAIHQELQGRGIIVRWTGRSTMAEEMPEAYKDVSRVVDVVHRAGISTKVARLKPMVVIKG
ncbi:RtcB family protein [Desulfospira joergensenii]|uniref:RtcB family protein n=1 Tax=Desulfospira joergensenii TaxID=53329 RepID=UPI0003B6F821|nr:RtcB family protein [Desulfospira joergensenii]